jgi:hypothetical protein
MQMFNFIKKKSPKKDKSPKVAIHSFVYRPRPLPNTPAAPASTATSAINVR